MLWAQLRNRTVFSHALPVLPASMVFRVTNSPLIPSWWPPCLSVTQLSCSLGQTEVFNLRWSSLCVWKKNTVVSFHLLAKCRGKGYNLLLCVYWLFNNIVHNLGKSLKCCHLLMAPGPRHLSNVFSSRGSIKPQNESGGFDLTILLVFGLMKGTRVFYENRKYWVLS